MPDEFVTRDRTARLVRVYAPNWGLRIRQRQRVRRLTGLSLLGGPLAIGLLLSVMLPGQAGAESAVNKHNGNYVFTHIDAALTIEGTRVVFQHAYNSLDSRVTTLGPAWTHSFAMRLLPSAQLSPDVIVVGPSGRSDLFPLGRGRRYL